MKKSLAQIEREILEERQRIIDQRIAEEKRVFESREKARLEWIRMNEKFSPTTSSSSSSAGGSRPLVEVDYSNLSISVSDFVPGIGNPQINSITMEISSNGVNPPQILERGIVYGLLSDPLITDDDVFKVEDGGTGIGEFTMENINIDDAFWFQEVFIRAYLITIDNNIIHSPSGLSPSIAFTPEICLAEGTKITLSDRSTKNIEDISYDDEILVWDFDNGEFSSSKPLWIKKSQTTFRYNLIKFSDGSDIKTISQHRIFNKESGKFTYPMTDETPIGTTTFNHRGEEISVIQKGIKDGEVNYFNVITDRHINMFANGILTSCRFNNIYPIENMKFEKDNRILRNKEEFNSVPDKFYNGLRLSEQSMSSEIIDKYVKRLIRNEVEVEIEESI
jgi:hypothetical protein